MSKEQKKEQEKMEKMMKKAEKERKKQLKELEKQQKKHSKTVIVPGGTPAQYYQPNPAQTIGVPPTGPAVSYPGQGTGVPGQPATVIMQPGQSTGAMPMPPGGGHGGGWTFQQ